MATEKRLIDLEQARNNVLEILDGKVSITTAVRIFAAMEEVTVDAVEVVRCKDCRWRNTVGCPYMHLNAVPRDDFDFCSDGERRKS